MDLQLEENKQIVVGSAEVQPEVRQEVPSKDEKPTKQGSLRRAVDHTGPYLHWLEESWNPRSAYLTRYLQPNAAAALQLRPPLGYLDQPSSGVALKFVINATERDTFKAPYGINCAVWTPGGKRCITGTNNGDFMLWNGRTLHMEKILQAHEASAVRALRLTHNNNFIVSSDEKGGVRVWKLHNELFVTVQAHSEDVHDFAFCPTDAKFCTASKDATLKVWDFATRVCESTLLGHGTDVRTVDWHPSHSLLASGSKEPTVKLWDPRAGKGARGTLRGHTLGITTARWNKNGNWLLTGSRDATCRVWEARMMKELKILPVGSEEVYAVAWHPVHTDLFVASHSPALVQRTGALSYWLAGSSKCQGRVSSAHGGVIWGLAWHPVGHLLATTGSDCAVKFWARNRPGDPFWRPGVGDSPSHPPPSGSAVPLPTSKVVEVIPGVGKVAPSILSETDLFAPVLGPAHQPPLADLGTAALESTREAAQASRAGHQAVSGGRKPQAVAHQLTNEAERPRKQGRKG